MTGFQQGECDGTRRNSVQSTRGRQLGSQLSARRPASLAKYGPGTGVQAAYGKQADYMARRNHPAANQAGFRAAQEAA